jgi:cyclophilin family peptidyl-prolyl cis-trans isomerase
VGTEKRERQRANRQLKYEELAKVEKKRKITRRAVIGAVAVVAGVALVVGIAWLGSTGGDEDDDASTASSLPLATVPTSVSASTVPAGAPASTVPGSSVAPQAFAYGTGECPPENVTEPVRTFSAAPQLCIDPQADYTATFRTSEGDIVVDLNTAEVPGTVNNFVTLARYGYYDDTSIFRTASSVAGEIIQGGGRSNSDSPGYTIPDEGSGYQYDAGQIVMARTSAPDSAGGQWFFVTAPPATPDPAGPYVVFGTITEGLDVARAIRELGGDDGAPSRDVTVETVEITEA